MRRLVWLAAGGTLIAGIAMTFHALGRIRQIHARSAARLGEAAELNALRAEIAPYQNAREAFEQTGCTEPEPLGALLQEVLPGLNPDDVRDLEGESVPGWRVVRREVSFNAAPVADVMKLVQRAERPPQPGIGNCLPWRLAKCVIQCSSGVPGTAQVVLLMEGLQKTEGR